MPPELTLPEFHRPVPLGTVGQAGRRLALEATPEECAALAGRLGILDLASLTASLQLLPEEGGSVRVEGRLVARLTQACVVSLDPVGQAVDEEIAFRLLPPGASRRMGPTTSTRSRARTASPTWARRWRSCWPWRSTPTPAPRRRSCRPRRAAPSPAASRRSPRCAARAEGFPGAPARPPCAWGVVLQPRPPVEPPRVL
ncbi:hypothetical protein ACFQY5_31600 [Paeniroseomonas aquatica]|uniref:hypothetical protein n=1 Tax=Paeniroseomonas aquatica TaxID=373043 RepID=UPI003605BF07